VIARPDADGRVCFTPSSTTHLVIDLFAAWGPAADAEVGAPTRVLDTRLDGGIPAARSVRRIPAARLAAAGAATGRSVFANLTITGARQRGFATAFGCDDRRPATSNINFRPGVNVANMVTVTPDASGDVCVYVHESAHVVVDVLGTAGSGFTGITPRRLLDTRG
jgi:hypothetical protein